MQEELRSDTSVVKEDEPKPKRSKSGLGQVLDGQYPEIATMTREEYRRVRGW